MTRGAILAALTGLACSSAPPTVDYAAKTIASGDGYRDIFPGAYVPGVGIKHYVATRGATDASGFTQVMLDSLDGTGTAAKPIITASSADPLSVQMAPLPEKADDFVDAVVYADSVQVDTGYGKLMYVDLSKAPLKPVEIPKGDNAFPQGIYFGQSGKQVLYFSENVNKVGDNMETIAGAKLFWWDGTSTAPKESRRATRITPHRTSPSSARTAPRCWWPPTTGTAPGPATSMS